MLRECVESIRHDRFRAFFYWLTFVLTVMYIFVLFAVAASDYYGFSMLHAEADLSAALMALSLIVCSAEIFFANDFFVRSKSKDLAVRMICGASFGKNVLFLGGQALILMLAALPFGILFGWMMIPLINAFFSDILPDTFRAAVSAESVFWIAGVLCYVIFWTLILNLSYAYRNTPVQMLYPQRFKQSASTVRIGSGARLCQE